MQIDHHASPEDQQRALYGATLKERFGAIQHHYGLSQRSLARVLGLSAPMLSQLMSAQRIKIGNPSVFERLVMLENRRTDPHPDQVLREVEESEPQQGTATTRTSDAVQSLLHSIATPQQLEAAARGAESAGGEQLARVLRSAVQH